MQGREKPCKGLPSPAWSKKIGGYMDSQIKAVADRLRGLRDVFDVTEEEAAEICEVPVEKYRK